MQKTVITTIAISALLTLTGCSSISELSAKTRVSYYDGYYKAMSEGAMENATKDCSKQFSSDQKTVLESCIEKEYNRRMSFYAASEAERQSRVRLD